MKRLIISTLISLTLLLPATAHAQTACQFVLGFATLHNYNPAAIGDCTDNQSYAPNGDALQHTTVGLMAWRKADNWTAFTNGYTTWINGPNGIQMRLNTDRFPWEAAAPVAPTVVPPTVAFPWDGIDSRLRAAGYGGPYDHANAEGQALANGCRCHVEWNSAGVASMGPSAPVPQPIYYPVPPLDDPITIRFPNGSNTTCFQGVSGYNCL